MGGSFFSLYFLSPSILGAFREGVLIYFLFLTPLRMLIYGMGGHGLDGGNGNQCLKVKFGGSAWWAKEKYTKALQLGIAHLGETTLSHATETL